jgi:hypothetical protein
MQPPVGVRPTWEYWATIWTHTMYLHADTYEDAIAFARLAFDAAIAEEQTA